MTKQSDLQHIERRGATFTRWQPHSRLLVRLLSMIDDAFENIILYPFTGHRTKALECKSVMR